MPVRSLHGRAELDDAARLEEVRALIAGLLNGEPEEVGTGVRFPLQRLRPVRECGLRASQVFIMPSISTALSFALDVLQPSAERARFDSAAVTAEDRAGTVCGARRVIARRLKGKLTVPYRQRSAVIAAVNESPVLLSILKERCSKHSPVFREVPIDRVSASRARAYAQARIRSRHAMRDKT